MVWFWRGPGQGYEYKALGPVERWGAEAWRIEFDIRRQHPSHIARWLWTGREWIVDERPFASEFYVATR